MVSDLINYTFVSKKYDDKIMNEILDKLSDSGFTFELDM